MNAYDESKFYRDQAEQQAREIWEAKGGKLSPAKCEELLEAMVKWAKKRCLVGDAKLIKEEE